MKDPEKTERLCPQGGPSGSVGMVLAFFIALGICFSRKGLKIIIRPIVIIILKAQQ